MTECDDLDAMLAALDEDARRIGVSRVNRKLIARDVREGFAAFVDSGLDPEDFRIILCSDGRGHARVSFGDLPVPDVLCAGDGLARGKAH